MTTKRVDSQSDEIYENLRAIWPSSLVDEVLCPMQTNDYLSNNIGTNMNGRTASDNGDGADGSGIDSSHTSNDMVDLSRTFGMLNLRPPNEFGINNNGINTISSNINNSSSGNNDANGLQAFGLWSLGPLAPLPLEQSSSVQFMPSSLVRSVPLSSVRPVPSFPRPITRAKPELKKPQPKESINQYDYFFDTFQNSRKKRQLKEHSSYCTFCKNNGVPEHVYMSHILKDDQERVRCPRLRKYKCTVCGASGDNAHTIRYCPVRESLLEQEYLKQHRMK